MALPLCLSIPSRTRFFFEISSTPSCPKHTFVTPHFAFPLARFNGLVQFPQRRPFNSKLTCIFAKKNLSEVFKTHPPPSLTILASANGSESRNWSNTLAYTQNFWDQTVKRFDGAFAGILIFLQVSCPIFLAGWDSWSVSPAEAVLYSPETKIPRTGELALRRAIPANTDMKAIQESLEDISYLLRIPQRKPYGTMEGNVRKALKIATDEKQSILSSIPPELRENGSALYTSLVDGKGGLQSLLQSIEDQDPDKVSVGLASSLDTVAQLELLQAPGLSFLLPNEYLNYPRLTGRGVVEFTIERGDGSTFSPEAAGEPRSVATLRVVLDGYSAPLTAGNFAKLVIDGAYDGVKLNCANQAIISDGELGNSTGYSVPLEIKPSGQFEPLYKTTLSVQDGELPVLPLSVYGAVAMAHSDVSEEYSSPNQFFIYLYNKRNSGLGGLSFDEGQFSVFGYTTLGRETLPQIKTGDVIRSAKLMEGQDRLVLPKNDNVLE